MNEKLVINVTMLRIYMIFKLIDVYSYPESNVDYNSPVTLHILYR